MNEAELRRLLEALATDRDAVTLGRAERDGAIAYALIFRTTPDGWFGGELRELWATPDQAQRLHEAGAQYENEIEILRVGDGRFVWALYVGRDRQPPQGKLVEYATGAEAERAAREYAAEQWRDLEFETVARSQIRP